jgi:hypothetical protein
MNFEGNYNYQQKKSVYVDKKSVDDIYASIKAIEDKYPFLTT